MPLPLTTEPDERESAVSYLLRCTAANGVSLKSLAKHLKYPIRNFVHAEDVDGLAWLTQTPPDWFRWRVQAKDNLNGRDTHQLFGQSWRPEVTFLNLRQQVCAHCLREQGFTRFEWDLAAFSACPDHGVVLQDICQHCQLGIEVNRPALDLCRCKHFFVDITKASVLAPQNVQAWCLWMGAKLSPSEGVVEDSGLEVGELLNGLTIDAATCIVIAFAGGSRELRSEKLHGTAPWVTSSAMTNLISIGLDHIGVFVQQGRVPAGVHGLYVPDLERLVLNGLTVTDRARAAWILRRARGRRYRAAVDTALVQQQDLFE